MKKRRTRDINLSAVGACGLDADVAGGEFDGESLYAVSHSELWVTAVLMIVVVKWVHVPSLRDRVRVDGDEPGASVGVQFATP